MFTTMGTSRFIWVCQYACSQKVDNSDMTAEIALKASQAASNTKTAVDNALFSTCSVNGQLALNANKVDTIPAVALQAQTRQPHSHR